MNPSLYQCVPTSLTLPSISCGQPVPIQLLKRNSSSFFSAKLCFFLQGQRKVQAHPGVQRSGGRLRICPPLRVWLLADSGALLRHKHDGETQSRLGDYPHVPRLPAPRIQVIAFTWVAVHSSSIGDFYFSLASFVFLFK